MKYDNYFKIIHLAENLKNNTRHSWTSTGRHESVAEHSWRISLMAYFLKDEFPDADINKVMLMCILHDIGEAFTGDIPAFDKTKEHTVIEDEKITSWINSLCEPYKNELSDLFTEMNNLETIEAKIYKSLDKMEALIQHNEAPISTWLPLEYDLQFTYGKKETEFSPYIKNMRDYIDKDSTEKIEKTKN